MGYANVPVDTGYKRYEMDWASTSTWTKTIDVDRGERFINAFALKNGVIDPDTEIGLGVSTTFPVGQVTFTPPDADPRFFSVIVIGVPATTGGGGI
jgi:hypothetical protein